MQPQIYGRYFPSSKLCTENIYNPSVLAICINTRWLLHAHLLRTYLFRTHPCFEGLGLTKKQVGMASSCDRFVFPWYGWTLSPKTTQYLTHSGGVLWLMTFFWFKAAERDFGFKSRDQLGPQFVAKMGYGFPCKFIRKLSNSNLSLCIVAVMCGAFIALGLLCLVTCVCYVRSNARILFFFCFLFFFNRI